MLLSFVVCVLGRFLVVWRVSWVDVLSFWDVLGGLWGVFGGLWEVFWGLLGALGAILAHLGPKSQHNTKKHGFLDPLPAPLGAILGTSFQIFSLKIRLLSVFVEVFFVSCFLKVLG